MACFPVITLALSGSQLALYWHSKLTIAGQVIGHGMRGARTVPCHSVILSTHF